MNKKNWMVILIFMMLSTISANTKSKQTFIFNNKTNTACIAKMYYDGEPQKAQYAGFPIPEHKKSKLKLHAFWWFAKQGLGLGNKPSPIVEVLNNHAANKLIITIPNVGQYSLDISGDQAVRDKYKINIYNDKTGKINIHLKAL